MTSRTRYFVIASLVVLTVGLGSGLLAYYLGFPTDALSRRGPEELQFVPSDAAVVAFADVQAIMASPFRQKIRAVFPAKEDGQRTFQGQTGINIETDIDRVVAAVGAPRGADTTAPEMAIVLARGRFDVVKIEALMREHGAQVEDYKGVRLLASEGAPGKPVVSLAFLESGLVGIGSASMVHAAVDLKAGGASVLTNDEVMGRVKDLDGGSAWAAGRFDVLANRAKLPAAVGQNLPAITWFSASAKIDSGLRGVFRADTRDEPAANALRDVVQGAMAFGRLQASAQPALQTLLQSVQLAATGKTVSLSFDLSPEVIDVLAGMANRPQSRPAPAP